MLSINVVLLFLAAYAQVNGRKIIPRLCVLNSEMEDCLRKAEVSVNGTQFTCKEARYNAECLEFLSAHKIKILSADPEFIYIPDAVEPGRYYPTRVFGQIRTKEKADDEFQYEVVAVVRNELVVDDWDSKKLKSCHSGMDTAGYDIPITMLLRKGALEPLSNRNVTQRENELQSLSSLFGQACIAGQWSPVPSMDQLWKSKYSNLCQLCQHPEKCDYPDDHSGDEGALKCLTKQGDIGWSKLDSVKRFFGINGTKTENDPSLYSYLCPDWTKVPLTKKPCTWGAMPWPGYLGSSSHRKNIVTDTEQYKAFMLRLYEKNDPEVLKLLGLKNGEKPIFFKKPITRKEYLNKGGYFDTIERTTRGGRAQARKIIMLVLDTGAEMKCQMMSHVLFVKGVRPPFQCRKIANIKDLRKANLQPNILMFVADPEEALVMERDFNMKPILHEVYGETTQIEMVAIVKNDSLINVKNFNGLKGKAACLPMNNTATFKSIVKYMLDNKFIQKDRCPYETAMKDFFEINHVRKMNGMNPYDDGSDKMGSLFCDWSDVAFVPLELAKKISRESNESLDVLCPNGERKPLNEAKDCALFKLPPRMVMVQNDINPVYEYEIKTALTTASKLFNEHPEYFKMFGEFDQLNNVLFTDHATKLEPLVGTVPSFEAYKSTAINYCETKKH